MKTLNLILISIALTILLANISLGLRIEEVYYDPINSENGGEAIVLYNPSSQEQNLSGYRIKSSSYDEDLTIPDMKIKPKGYFLLTDEGWEQDKDSSDFPSSDYEESMTLTNSDGGIAIIDNNNNTLDKVGWGNSQQISNELYYGTPADGVEEGKSLLRTSSTQDNKHDFISSTPILKSSSSTFTQNTTQNSLIINLEVGRTIRVKDINFSHDDFPDNNTQIIPSPGEKKNVNLSFTLTHPENQTKIKNVTSNTGYINKTQVINTTSARYKTSLDINYNQTPGNHTVKIKANNKTKNITYKVMSLKALKLDTNELNITSYNKDTVSIEGDQNMTTPDKPTIKNIGNTNFNVSMKTRKFSDRDKNLSLDNIRFAFNNEFNSSLSGKISSQKKVGLNLNPTKATGIGLQFNLTNVTRGDYTGRIAVSASD